MLHASGDKAGLLNARGLIVGTLGMILFTAMNLAGAYAVMFEKPGLTAEIVTPNPAPASTNEVKLKVTAAPA